MIDESEFMQHIMDCNVTEPIRDEPPVRTQKPTSSKVRFAYLSHLLIILIVIGKSNKIRT